MKKLIPIIAVLFIVSNLKAGTITSKSNSADKNFKIAVSGFASTNGFGGNLVYSFSDRLLIRGGYEKLKFIYNFDFDENEIDYNADLNFKTGSISVLADYYPLKYFYLTGGAGFHLMNSVFNGIAVSDWEYGDIYIKPEDIGDFKISIKPAFRLSPYAGVGFGRNLGLEKRVALNFEMGAFYLGKHDVDIEATGLLEPTANPSHSQEELFEKQLERYSFYPVIKFGISVRIF